MAGDSCLYRCDFFVVGAPKCGTTTLCRHLEANPSVGFSSPKELNFFSSEEILTQNLYYKERVITSKADYEASFPSGGRLLGEGSVSYLYYSSVPKKIYSYNPSAKIIVMVRNPVDRAFSHYLMDKRLGYVKEGFEKIFRNQAAYRNHYQQYFELGLYGEQIARYIDCFGKEQVKVIYDKDLRKDPLGSLVDVCDFLGIKRPVDVAGRAHNEYKSANNFLIERLYQSFFVRRMLRTLLPYNFQSKLKALLFTKKGKPELCGEFREELREYYRDDVGLLVEISGDKRFFDWLN